MSIQANYDDVHNQLTGYGLVIDPRDGLLVGTAKPRRVHTDDDAREKRGWYWLNEVMIDGAAYIVGAYGIYHGNDSGKQAVKLNRDGKALPIDGELRAAMKARQAENLKRMQAMRADEAQRAARKAAHAWSVYVPAGESDYLVRKGVGSHGVRFHPDGGTMAVPMTDARGTVHGLQIIRGKHRGGKLEKQYWPKGLDKQGHYHLIGGLPSWICLVAEGYATAATLHEATGLPVAVAFDAGNLLHVSVALHKHYKRAKLLICADDDYLTAGNPGVTAASAAAHAVNGATVAPVFAADRDGKKITDFNDLQAIEGQHAVRSQIEASLLDLKWSAPASLAGVTRTEGGGEYVPMAPRLTIDEAAMRYWLTYHMGGKVLFDELDRQLVHKDDVLNLLPSHGWDELKKHPGWRVVRKNEIGFDPTEKDTAIRCNLFGGWPTTPRDGKCSALLGLLYHLCSNEDKPREAYDWIVKWLAYPLQNRGAKMHSAIVVHGMQGVGKSRFFEVYAKIFGEYSQVLGQEALEDKFNSDWAEKKLFILADEVLAKAEMYHVKNRLKGYITGETIRVRAMHVGGRTEKNHMNIVFLSNEKMPVVLENDDRRHVVLYVPPPPDAEFMAEVNEEIANGGAAALHHYLLNIDLGEFKPWSRPPMTQAKRDLIELSAGSEERFMSEWQRLELEGRNGEILPFCPCLGSHLYRVYEDWCKRQGEFRSRPANHFLNYIGKQPGWSAGKPESTWATLKDRGIKSRKMVVPGVQAMTDALGHAPPASRQHNLLRDRFGTKAEWLTACFFEFELAMGGQP